MFKKSEYDEYNYQFIQEYDSLAPQRVFKAILTGWILYLSFSILDVFMAPESVYLFLFIRFVLVTPILWILYIISQLKIMLKHIQIFLFGTTILAGCGILAMIFLSKTTEPSFYSYYAGIILLILWIYALCPIRFQYASTATWTIIVIYNVIVLFHQNLTYYPVESLSFKMFINNNFFLISAAIIGMVAGKTIENFRKRDFMQRMKLQLAHTELEKKAHYDILTSLPNRLMFIEKSQILINLNKRDNKKSYILFLDLDGFKKINDTFGHAEGDNVLKITAEIINESTRETDIPCRFGGDEFLILLTHCSGSKDAEIVSKRIITSLQNKPTFHSGATFIPFPTASIGISEVEPGYSLENNISNADSALYKAKTSGKNNYNFN